MFERECLEEALGADAGPAAKQALEMMRAQIDLTRNPVEIRSVPIVFLEEPERLFDPAVVSGRGVICCACHGLDHSVSVHTHHLSAGTDPCHPVLALP